MIDGESTTRIERPVDEVFDYVGNPVNDEKWHKNVLKAWRTSEGPIGVGSTFHWDAKFFGRRQADVKVTKYEPTNLFATHVQSGWMEVVVTYLIAPQNDATRITRRTETPLPGLLRLVDPIVRPIARPFVSKDNAKHLSWLKEALERQP
jgi:hypothetical protein